MIVVVKKKCLSGVKYDHDISAVLLQVVVVQVGDCFLSIYYTVTIRERSVNRYFTFL